MAHLTPFITHHWELCVALLILLVLIALNEHLAQKKRATTVTPAQAIQLINHDGAVVIDLRDTELFRAGHIVDALKISTDALSQKRMEKYKNKPLVLVCARGQQSAILAAELRTQGFVNPMVLAGGMAAWQAEQLPLIKGTQ